MMHTRWDLGDSVRVVRNVRNDGTFPGAELGELLIRCGSTGTVIDIGTFLMDQIIYTVHFLDVDRIVGCREEELIGADEPWLPSAFTSRERVLANKALVMPGSGRNATQDTQITPGSVGEILRVLRDGDAPVYHVHFDSLPGRVFAVPESALRSLNGVDPA